MLRVPGEDGSLLAAKARGADVRMVYSPLDALAVAREQPERQVVFFAIGFETTAPTTAMAVLQAEREGLANFSLLVSHVLVPPAIEALLSDPDNSVQGFLAAGHVCTIMGYWEYEPIARRLSNSDRGDRVRAARPPAGPLYVHSPTRGGARPRSKTNTAARSSAAAIAQRRTFWRGYSRCSRSAGAASARFRQAALRSAPNMPTSMRFDVLPMSQLRPSGTGECISGEVLRGRKKPGDCPAFGTRCTPEHPLGATMVSSEGACAAYYRYRRPRDVVGAVAAGRS